MLFLVYSFYDDGLNVSIHKKDNIKRGVANFFNKEVFIAEITNIIKIAKIVKDKCLEKKK